MEVHSVLGNGFLEAVYQEALTLEFNIRKIPYQCEVELEINYKDKVLNKKYRSDFICFESIVVEMKACSGLVDAHMAQVINYLNATDLRLGILVNFGSPSLTYRRIIL